MEIGSELTKFFPPKAEDFKVDQVTTLVCSFSRADSFRLDTETGSSHAKHLRPLPGFRSGNTYCHTALLISGEIAFEKQNKKRQRCNTPPPPSEKMSMF